MKIGLIGPQGFLGHSILQECHRRNFKTFEITSNSDVELAVKSGVELVINANGNSKKYLADRNPLLDFEKNVNSTLEYLHSISNHGINYIHLSSGEVYGEGLKLNAREDSVINPDRLTNYGLSKYIAELVVRKYAPSWKIFRIGGLVGPFLAKGPIFDLMSKRECYFSDESMFQILSTQTTEKMILEISEKVPENAIFNLTSPDRISISEVKSLLNISKVNAPELLTFESNMDTSKCTEIVSLPSSKDELLTFLQSPWSSKLSART